MVPDVPVRASLPAGDERRGMIRRRRGPARTHGRVSRGAGRHPETPSIAQRKAFGPRRGIGHKRVTSDPACIRGGPASRRVWQEGDSSARRTAAFVDDGEGPVRRAGRASSMVSASTIGRWSACRCRSRRDSPTRASRACGIAGQTVGSFEAGKDDWEGSLREGTGKSSARCWLAAGRVASLTLASRWSPRCPSSPAGAFALRCGLRSREGGTPKSRAGVVVKR